MNGKKVISTLLAVLLLMSLAACGSRDAGGAKPDEGEKELIKIGIMQFGEFDALLNASEGFKVGLAEAGYIEGENVAFNYLSAAADTSN
ncbi:MAG TPA: ABC transporter substrate-binding protein, partial [Bacillota bacterium]|nr:ABC transporter substrate-binding protein [Bacillota bacterium]